MSDASGIFRIDFETRYDKSGADADRR